MITQEQALLIADLCSSWAQNSEDRADLMNTAYLHCAECHSIQSARAHASYWVRRLIYRTPHSSRTVCVNYGLLSKELERFPRPAACECDDPSSSIDLLDALYKLPEDIRAVIVMHFIDQLSFLRISDMTHEPLVSIYRKVSEGLALLRKALSAYSEPDI